LSRYPPPPFLPFCFFRFWNNASLLISGYFALLLAAGSELWLTIPSETPNRRCPFPTSVVFPALKLLFTPDWAEKGRLSRSVLYTIPDFPEIDFAEQVFCRLIGPLLMAGVVGIVSFSLSFFRYPLLATPFS